MQEIEIIKAVKTWLENFVIELNLCPFAKREFVNNRIRFSLSAAASVEQLLVDLQDELFLLDEDAEIETTLLIHPQVLQNFSEYNQFLNTADAFLEQQGKLGVYQIASFHPQYRFSESGENDAENYSNRSPFPLLHLLREASLEKAIARHPNIAEVVLHNIELLSEMGKDKIEAILNKQSS